MSSKSQLSLPDFIGLVLVAVFLGGVIFLLVTAQEGVHSDNAEQRIIRPTNVDRDSDPDRALIETSSVGTLWVKSGRGGVGANEAVMAALSEAQAASDLVAIAFDGMTREIRKVYSPVVDTITQVAPGEGSGKNLLVKGSKMPSLLILPASHPRFAELRNQLESAMREGDPVAMAVLPGTDVIQDVAAAP